MFWCPPMVYYPMPPQPLTYNYTFVPPPSSPPEQVEKSPAIKREEPENKDQTVFLSLFQKLVRKHHVRSPKKAWTAQEDRFLLEMQQKGESWEKIAFQLGIENPQNCKRRFARIHRQKKKWPVQIDRLIKKYFQEKGMQWRIIVEALMAQFPELDNLNPSSVRDRYHNHLREGIQRKQWTVEEDLLLMKLICTKGKAWKSFVQSFDGKTQLELKNRYHGVLKSLASKAEKYEAIYLKKRRIYNEKPVKQEEGLPNRS